MKMTLYYWLFGVLLSLACVCSIHGNREKRHLLDLDEMIGRVTKLSALVDLNGYGCYCGWGGHGTPVDGIDACCQAHDNCYGNVTEKLGDVGCSPKWDPYEYQVKDERNGPVPRLVLCGDKEKRGFREAHKNSLYCHYEICKCDKGLVECIEQFKWKGKKGCLS